MNHSKLVIVRHHESEWNKLGLWTGGTDVHLSDFGKEKSKEMGLLIQDIHFDKAYVSTQCRTRETLDIMLEAMGQQGIDIESNSAHNERDYGEYTGKNKWEVRDMIGEEAFNAIRRDWDCPIPGGETLKHVYGRTIPFFTQKVLPELIGGKNILIVSHGNAIRSILKFIENIPDEEMKNVDMLFSAALIYEINSEGHMVTKEVRSL